MFANHIKIIFVLTAYSPIIFIVWAVEVYNNLTKGNQIGLINKPIEIFNRLNLIFIFIILLLACYLFMKAARGKLTINNIGVKSIKSADLNMNSLLLSYFLPCIELFKKDPIFIFGWFVVLIILIVINRGTYFYNPIIKLFGYRYYEVTTNSGVVYTMISKKKLVNTNEVKRYSQLTDYVILNQL